MGCCEFSASGQGKITGMHVRTDSGPLTLLRTESRRYSKIENEAEDGLQTAKTTMKTVEKESEYCSENDESIILPLPDVSSCSSLQSWKANSL